MKPTCSPNNSSDTYNLCKSVNPTIDDKFTYKFTLNPAEPSPNYSDCNITKHHSNKITSEKEKGRHLLSEIDTQSQVEAIKDPNINMNMLFDNSEKKMKIIGNGRHLMSEIDTQFQVEKKKDPNEKLERNSGEKVKERNSRRHLLSNNEIDTKSQVDTKKSPVKTFATRGKVKNMIKKIENHKRSPIIKRNLVKKYSPTLEHKNRNKLKERIKLDSPNEKQKIERKLSDRKPETQDRNINEKIVNRIVENLEKNITVKPSISSKETIERNILEQRKDAFKILMESPGNSARKKSKFKIERKKRKLEMTPTSNKYGTLDQWLRK